MGSSSDWKFNASRPSVTSGPGISDDAAIKSTYLSDQSEISGSIKPQLRTFSPISHGSQIDEEQNILGSQVDQAVGSVTTSTSSNISTPNSDPRPVDQGTPRNSFANIFRGPKTDARASCQRSSRVPSLKSLRRRIGSHNRPNSISSSISLIRSAMNASNADSISYQETALQKQGLKQVRPIFVSLSNITRFISSTRDPSSLTIKEENLFNELIDNELLETEGAARFSLEFVFAAPWRSCCNYQALIADAKSKMQIMRAIPISL